MSGLFLFLKNTPLPPPQKKEGGRQADWHHRTKPIYYTKGI